MLKNTINFLMVVFFYSYVYMTAVHINNYFDYAIAM